MHELGPVCSGRGFGFSNTCQLISFEEKVLSLSLPVGVRAGYISNVPGAGNEAIINMQKVVGQFQLTVTKVNSEHFVVYNDRVEVNIEMSVREALEVLQLTDDNDDCVVLLWID